MTAPRKPPRVKDHYEFWMQPPPEPSERLLYWLDEIVRGTWRPNRFFLREGYDTRAQIMGVYMWEYLHVLYPIFREMRW